MKGLQLKRINNYEVEGPPMPRLPDLPAKGSHLCLTCYANIYLCAKRKSGKTWALYNLIKECIGKDTKVIIFCSTIYKDPVWLGIRNWLEEHEIDVTIYTSLYPDGKDVLAELVADLNEEAEEREKEQKELKESGNKKPEDKPDDIETIMEKIRTYGMDGYLEMSLQEKKKPKKKKFLEPEYCIVLDDIGNQLKTPSLLALLTWNRHYRSKVIVSSQYLCHLLPESRKMIDVFMIFKGHPEAKLKAIYEDADVNIPFEDFERLYKKSTKHQHSFLYMDTERGEYRKNFDHAIVIKNPDDNEE